jgi:hypothetical protein
MNPLAVRASLLSTGQRQLESPIHRSMRARRTNLLRPRSVVQKRWLATPADIALDANRNPDDSREKVVILGSGWAGTVVSRSSDEARR